MKMFTKKILFFAVAVIVFGGFFAFVYNDRVDNGEEIGESLNADLSNYEINTSTEYQGPVPLGYDLEHFSKTGEMIKEVDR